MRLIKKQGCRTLIIMDCNLCFIHYRFILGINDLYRSLTSNQGVITDRCYITRPFFLLSVMVLEHKSDETKMLELLLIPNHPNIDKLIAQPLFYQELSP